ncbi:MAG TPA: RDD family protein [Epulopiscium sp.]|nr:RDD family protein [Candidatus Epulonipiscium sp.]
MKYYMSRILAYILNVIIIMIPTVLLANFIFFKYQELADIQHFTGYEILDTVDLSIDAIFLPRIFIDAITRAISIPTALLSGGSLLISFTLFDSIISYIFKADIGKKLLKVKIVSNNNDKIKFTQIFLRCILKYVTLIFFPFLLIYPILKKDRVSLHDKIARTKVIPRIESYGDYSGAKELKSTMRWYSIHLKLRIISIVVFLIIEILLIKKAFGYSWIITFGLIIIFQVVQYFLLKDLKKIGYILFLISSNCILGGAIACILIAEILIITGIGIIISILILLISGLIIYLTGINLKYYKMREKHFKN